MGTYNPPASAGGATIATGSYTGDDVITGRQITTGFKCSAVIIFNATDIQALECCIAIPSAGRTFTGTAVTTSVKPHATDGFIVGHYNKASFNDSGEIFYYWAISE